MSMDISESLVRLEAPFSSFAPKLRSLSVAANVARRSTSRKALEAFIERLDCDFETLKEFTRGRMEEARRLVVEEGKDLAVYLANELRMLETFCRLYIEGMRNVARLAEPTDGSLAGLVFLLHVRGDRLHNRISDEGREVALRLNLSLFPPRASQKAEPNTRFERTAIKFWLPPEELFGLKLVCGANMPLDLFLATANVDQVRVSSVYFDTPHFSHYTRRVRREEGSTLIRLRAYGACPTEAWVEVKTHHESWVRDQSIKERFKLPFDGAVDFLRGAISVDDLFGTSGPEGTRQLALNVQDQISRRALVPICVTDYYRSAYQSVPTRNEFVRVTIDSQLTVTDLRHKTVEEIVQRLAHPEDIVTGTTSSTTSCDFPFSVVETKIHGSAVYTDGPPWLEKAMKVARRAECFSKYQLGVASFVSHSTIISPVWWPTLQSLSKNAGKKGADQAAPSGQRRVASKDGNSAAMFRGDADVAGTQLLPNGHAMTLPVLQPLAANQFSVVEGPINLLQQAVQGLPALRVPQFLLPTELSTNINTGTSLKIEPKTHFANERTFIQWHSAALFLVTVGKLTSRGYQMFPTAQLLFFLALFIMAYALWRYHWRRRALNSRLVQRYDDPFGPSVMTFAMGIAILALFFDSLSGPITIVDVPSSPSSLGPKQWSHVVNGDIQGIVYRDMNDTVYIAYTDATTLHLGFTAVPWNSGRSYLGKFNTKSGYLQNTEVTHLVPTPVHALDHREGHFLLGTECGSVVELVDPFEASEQTS